MDPEMIAAAYAYAWWLTGDEARAEQAVRNAVASVSSATAMDAPTEVLRAVRSAAIAAPTMCPASELALLHDAHGIALGDAAELVSIDVRDAGTELAHGRLEALIETVEGDVAHPERLGGLAVGNPADVAHARQCGPCGEVSTHLADGRATLTDLAHSAAPPPPPELAASLPATATAAGAVTDSTSPAPPSRQAVVTAVAVIAVTVIAALVVWALAGLLPGAPGQATGDVGSREGLAGTAHLASTFAPAEGR